MIDLPDNRADRGARFIDLNADLGEGCAHDAALLDIVTSASIACNEHAGSLDGIRHTLEWAAAKRVIIGAHPGFADRAHFGRREQNMASAAVADLIVAQWHTLDTLASEFDLQVRFIKPHGALYNQAQHQPEIARGVIDALAKMPRLALVGQPETLLDRLTRSTSIPYISEGFPDRRYRTDGSLVPRTEPNAILHDRDEMEAQVLRLARGGRVQTLCIHGDDPGAVSNATLVRDVLARGGISLRSFMNEPL